MLSRIILRNASRLFVTARPQNQNNPKFCSNAANEELLRQRDQPISMKNPFEKEKVKCILCKYNIEPSYKNVQLLSQFQSPYTGRTYGRHITGLCKRMQEKVDASISRAQSLGLMGYMTKEPKYLKDPKLFNSERPLKPHKW